jgi:hypothetical protein
VAGKPPEKSERCNLPRFERRTRTNRVFDENILAFSFVRSVCHSTRDARLPLTRVCSRGLRLVWLRETNCHSQIMHSMICLYTHEQKLCKGTKRYRARTAHISEKGVYSDEVPGLWHQGALPPASDKDAFVLREFERRRHRH